jgi:hypothetical protein
MQIIVYSSEKNADETRLLETIRFADTEVCRSIEDLRHCLNIPSHLRKLIILAVKDQDELLKIKTLIDLYSDLLLFVILAKDCPETNRTAYTMGSRYTTYQDDSYRELAEILRQVLFYYG